MENINIVIGKRIREIRLSKNLTQQQLANLVECELLTINRIELGKTNARFSSIISISLGLEVSIYDLVKGSQLESFFDYEFFRTVHTF